MNNNIDFINMVRRNIEEVTTFLHYKSVFKMIFMVQDDEEHFQLLEELEKRCLKAGVYTGRFKEKVV
jgi:hypothetical protein